MALESAREASNEEVIFNLNICSKMERLDGVSVVASTTIN